MTQTLYIYTNTNELNTFLTKNIIFPLDEDSYETKKTISFSEKNCIVLYKKRYSKKSIQKECTIGFFDPLVLELSLDLSNETNFLEKKDVILLNDFINFSCVRKIYYINDTFNSYLLNDIFIFESLVSKDEFDFSDEELTKADYGIKFEEINVKLFQYQKIQAFFMARYGFLKVEKFEKKKLKFARNIDIDSFKYISDIPYEEYVEEYYDFEKKKKQISIANVTNQETTFLNDSFPALLKTVIAGGTPDDSLMSQDKKNVEQYLTLYGILLKLNDGESFLPILENQNGFHEIVSQVKLISKKFEDNIVEIKKFFTNSMDRLLVTIYILNGMLDKNLDDAFNYLSNFVENSELSKEILSLYGLAKGMNAITSKLKKDAGLLLYSYNMTNSYFKTYCSMGHDYRTYYIDRDFNYQIIMKNGYNFRIFDEKMEMNYCNKDISSFVKMKYGIKDKNLTNKYLKGLSAYQLHDLFLNIKKRERGDLNE